MAHVEVQEQYPTAGRIGPPANDSPEPGIPLSRYQDFVRSIASLQDAHHFLAIHYFLRCEFCTDSSSESSNKALRKRHWRRSFRPLASFDRGSFRAACNTHIPPMQRNYWDSSLQIILPVSFSRSNETGELPTSLLVHLRKYIPSAFARLRSAVCLPVKSVALRRRMNLTFQAVYPS
jgi:hypothetical protein